jgi:serine/threonine-protein kinase haspin
VTAFFFVPSSVPLSVHTSDFSLSLFFVAWGVKNGVKLEKNLNNVKSQRIRIAPLHFSSFSKEERREREREKSLFGFFCSVSSVHILNTQTRRRGSAKTGTQSNKMLSPFKSWNKQREVRKDGERMFDDISNNNNNDNNNNNNNNTSSNSTVTYKTRLMTFFGRRKKKTMAAVPKKEKATQGNNNNDDDKENNNDVGTVPLAGDNETKTTTTTTKEVVVKKPTQKRAQKLKENVQKSKEENAVNARLREQRDYFNKIDKMSSLQSESECSPLPARNNAGRNMELSPLGVIKAVGGLEFDGVDAKKAMKETLEEQQQRHQHQYAKDEEQEEAEEEEFSFPTPQQQPQFLLGNNATPSPASQDRRTAEWLVSSQLPAVSEHALLESVRNLTLEEKINEENEDEKEAASSSSSPSSIKETESIAQTKSQSYKSPFNKSARSSRRRTSSVHSYHSIHDYKPVLATKNAHRVSEGSLPKEQRRSSLGGAIRKSIVGLQATVVNTDAPSPLVEIENEEEEKEEEVKTEEKSATVTKEDSSELGPLEALLKECEQSPEDVKTVAEEVKKAKDPNSKKKSITVEKIGEGTYGEAYMCDNVVLKVVPISNEKKEPGTNTKKGKENVENNAEECEGEEDYPQMVASEIRAEVAVAKRLTKLQPHLVAPKAKNVTDGFVPLDRVAICKGPYDKLLLKAWESFDFRKVSENENPSMWPKDQLYVVFSTRNGGIDLENFNLHDCKEAFSVLLQITVALAVAEEACGFEHRDLHWGNVLCKRDKVDLENDNTRKARLNGVDVTIDTYGVTASIIDFTLSRVEIKDESDVVFCDLSLDPELFEGPEDDAQSETYRRMRKALNNQWGASCPQTNAFWLHYLADTLLTKKEFKMNPNQKQSLEKFRMNCLQYDCAADAIWDPLFAGMWSSGRK